MKRYTVDHQNYRIFKTTNQSTEPNVHFQWGKFDFRISFVNADSASKELFTDANGRSVSVGKFEVLYRENWFQFVKPTAHGMQLEETLWRRDGQDYFAEFPKDLSNIAEFLGSEELNLTSSKAAV